MCQVEYCSNCHTLERRIAVLERRITYLLTIIGRAAQFCQVVESRCALVLVRRGGVARGTWSLARAGYTVAREVRRILSAARGC